MWEFVFHGNGASLKRCRATFHRYFQPGALAQYRPAELAVAKRLLGKLLETPADFRAHAHW